MLQKRLPRQPQRAAAVAAHTLWSGAAELEAEDVGGVHAVDVCQCPRLAVCCLLGAAATAAAADCGVRLERGLRLHLGLWLLLWLLL